MVHLRWAGRSYEFSFEDLGVHRQATDKDLKTRLAARLEATPAQLAELVVDRRPHGDIVIRPSAIYG